MKGGEGQCMGSWGRTVKHFLPPAHADEKAFKGAAGLFPWNNFLRSFCCAVNLKKTCINNPNDPLFLALGRVDIKSAYTNLELLTTANQCRGHFLFPIMARRKKKLPRSLLFARHLFFFFFRGRQIETLRPL